MLIELLWTTIGSINSEEKLITLWKNHFSFYQSMIICVIYYLILFICHIYVLNHITFVFEYCHKNNSHYRYGELLEKWNNNFK